ncbi:MAG: serine hydrolase [Desulfobacterales bacterium]
MLAEPLEYEPGSKEVYSDLGFILLAWVVEYISGVRLDAFVNDRIFCALKNIRLVFHPLCSNLTRSVMKNFSLFLPPPPIALGEEK